MGRVYPKRKLSVYDCQRIDAADPLVPLKHLVTRARGWRGSVLYVVCPACDVPHYALYVPPHGSRLPRCRDCLDLTYYNPDTHNPTYRARRAATDLQAWHDIAATVPEYRAFCAWVALQAPNLAGGAPVALLRAERLRIAAYEAVEAALRRLALDTLHRRAAAIKGATPHNRAAASARLKPKP